MTAGGNGRTGENPFPHAEFGRLLRTIRTDMGISHQELGSRLTVGGSTVAAWERGERVPDRPTIVHDITEALRLPTRTVDALLKLAGYALLSPEEAEELPAFPPPRRRRVPPPPIAVSDESQPSRFSSFASWRGWPRAEKMTLIVIVLAVLTLLTRFVVPEVRELLGLDPSATPTPTLEPVTVVLDWVKKTRQEVVEGHRPVTVRWRWLVCQPDVVKDHLDTLTFEVTLDGSPIDTGNIAPRYEGYREEDLYDGRWWVLYWTYPMGALGKGSSYRLDVEYHVNRNVPNGCDLDGDGHEDITEAGSHEVTTLELTVQ